MDYFQHLFEGLEQAQSVQFLLLIFLTLLFGALLGALLQTGALTRWKNRYQAKEEERKSLQQQLGAVQQQTEELEAASMELVRLQQQDIRQRALLQETQHQLENSKQQLEIALNRGKYLELELEAAKFKLDDLMMIKSTMVSKEEYQRLVEKLQLIENNTIEQLPPNNEQAHTSGVPDYSYQLQVLEKRLAALESKTNTSQQ